MHHWSQARDWGDHHLLTLASGALLAHTLVGFLDIHTTTPHLDLVALGLIMSVSLLLLAIRVHNRTRSVTE